MSADPGRQRRQRAEHERQAVVFGVILATLAVVGLLGLAVYTNTVKLPFFDRGFSTAGPSPTGAVPCPATGTLPVAAAKITVNVLNSTSQSGLATQTGQALQADGFTIGQTGNSGATVDGVGAIEFGPAAVAQAYTLLAYLPNARLTFDATRTKPDVDLVIGSSFTGIAANVSVDANTPLTGAAGCIPLASATATPR